MREGNYGNALQTAVEPIREGAAKDYSENLGLIRLVQTGDESASERAMEELLALCGEQTALNVAPPTQDAVLMGEVAHSRPEGVRAVYVVGANQGLLPVPAGDGGLIADRERQFFLSVDLPCNATMQQHNLQGQHRLYAAEE